MDKVKNTFLISPNDVKAGSYINYNVDDSMLAPAIREASDIHLQAIIGSNLYYRLQELVYNHIMGAEDSIDDNDNALYKELLDDYVHPYLTMKTQAVLCLPISIKIRNYGLAKDGDTNINQAQLSEVMASQTRYNTVAAKYATQLSKYLCLHKQDFPELEETSCGCGLFIPAVLGKTFVETGLVLGTTENGCNCC